MMLEQEMWKRLPTPAGRRPNFKAALEGKGKSQAAQAFDTSSFASWVAAGNPWKRQESGESLLSGSYLPGHLPKQSSPRF